MSIFEGSDALRKKAIITGIVVLIIFILSYFLFFREMLRKSRTDEVRQKVEQSSTKETVRLVEGNRSPLSGEECENWNKRPVAVMQPSDMQARPAAGFSEADMVFELPAYTSSVTRLMGVYVCNIPKEIGAMRSSRHDYIHIAKGLDAIFVHWGGSVFALEILKKGVIDNIDCLVYSGKYCDRWDWENDPVMRMEDSGHVKSEALLSGIQDLGYRKDTNFEGYPHQLDAPLEERPEGGNLRVAFANPYDVEYEYDKESNSYIRFWNEIADKDRNNGNRIAPKNVVVLIAKSEQINLSTDYVARGVDNPWDLVPEDHRDGIGSGVGRYNNLEFGDPWFDTVDTGQAFYYMNGKEFRGTWKKNKEDINSKLYFYDEAGKEIPFVVGQVWVDVLEPGQALRWTVKSEEASPVQENTNAEAGSGTTE
ncbi:MAG: DUF3048 domain-containing protein [Candidatus Moraniibacteriota bacterium]|nr:MAG: DUF3048 domain-containing protein [Candidatus Moranbacteria bacterium]